ncbi:MAG TPA: TlyA family RNA methyltransferase, partial [Bacillota bacterium]|nr:TlyA family RNA methyltransferase [Bacillota bacterium]
MRASNKERLDVVLVNKKFVATREKAKRMIMAGLVYIEGKRADKPGTLINPELDIRVKEDPNPFVSRGGIKLAKALNKFDFPVEGGTFMDIGASTGGFTDCLLQNGAAKIYSIDVGYGQLAWKLRQDPRVIIMERTNIRNISKDDINDNIDGVV